MSRTALALFCAIAAIGLSPLAARAQSADILDRTLADIRGVDGSAGWRDQAHRRDRLDAVEGYPEFAEQESAIRVSLDSGLSEGQLDRNDFLIFGRQLHQTELLEARDMRLYGETLSAADRDLILGELNELLLQIDEARGQLIEARGQR